MQTNLISNDETGLHDRHVGHPFPLDSVVLPLGKLEAPAAASATSCRLFPTDASTAAMTAPSTSGAELIETRCAEVSAKASTAISVAMTALPRSSKTRIPSGPSTFCSAARIFSTEVPKSPSAVPPATAIATFPCAICPASSATPSASRTLCETITKLTDMSMSPFVQQQERKLSDVLHVYVYTLM